MQGGLIPPGQTSAVQAHSHGGVELFLDPSPGHRSITCMYPPPPPPKHQTLATALVQWGFNEITVEE